MSEKLKVKTAQRSTRKLHDLVRCPYCDGSGNEGWVQQYHECVECGGSGKLKLQECDLKYLAKMEKEK